MKITISKVITVCILLLVILAATCPTEEDYYQWLSANHGIERVYTEMGQEFSRNGQIIDWKSRAIRSAGIFMRVKDRYAQNDMSLEIRSVGLLNMFFQY